MQRSVIPDNLHRFVCFLIFQCTNIMNIIIERTYLFTLLRLGDFEVFLFFVVTTHTVTTIIAATLAAAGAALCCTGLLQHTAAGLAAPGGAMRSVENGTNHR